MIKRPVIGITGDWNAKEGARYLPAYRTVCVSNAYVEAVAAAGAVPVLIPITHDKEAIGQAVEMTDGLLVTGGGDLVPQLYGQEPDERQGFFSEGRDFLDLCAIRRAEQLGRPILGICRGIQSINVAFGGTLLQDLSLREGPRLQHMQHSEPDGVGHTVDIDPASRFFALLGAAVQTNSFHHQVVDRVAPGFAATGRARDGVIELIEKQGDGFVVGIQWHPELMAAGGSRPMQELFGRFAEACRRE